MAALSQCRSVTVKDTGMPPLPLHLTTGMPLARLCIPSRFCTLPSYPSRLPYFPHLPPAHHRHAPGPLVHLHKVLYPALLPLSPRLLPPPLLTTGMPLARVCFQTNRTLCLPAPLLPLPFLLPLTTGMPLALLCISIRFCSAGRALDRYSLREQGRDAQQEGGFLDTKQQGSGLEQAWNSWLCKAAQARSYGQLGH